MITISEQIDRQIFYYSWRNTYRRLKTDALKIEFINAILDYGFDQKEYEGTHEGITMAMDQIMVSLDNYRESVLNGKKGGAKKGGSKGGSTNTNTNIKENINTNTNNKDKEKCSSSLLSGEREEEIKKEKGNSTNSCASAPAVGAAEPCTQEDDDIEYLSEEEVRRLAGKA